jgi:type II secretory pathway component PulJ
MRYISVDKNLIAFTIVELMVSVVISVILLGGIFYFMSDTILGISRSSSQANFLKNFYGFTTILDTGDLEILHDYTGQ